MKRPSLWLSVAVVISALSPAGIVACQILDKKSYADIPRSGHAATFTVPRGQLKYVIRRQITQDSRFHVIFN